MEAYAGIDSRYVPSRRCTGNAEHAALEIPQRDVDDAEEPDRELLGAVELPESVPEPLASVGALADELLAQSTRSTMSASIGPLHSW